MKPWEKTVEFLGIRIQLRITRPEYWALIWVKTGEVLGVDEIGEAERTHYREDVVKYRRLSRREYLRIGGKIRGEKWSG